MNLQEKCAHINKNRQYRKLKKSDLNQLILINKDNKVKDKL